MTQRPTTASIEVTRDARVHQPSDDLDLFAEAAQRVLEDVRGDYTRVQYAGVTEHYETTPDGFQWVYEWIFTLHP